jgi:hormone-sensitive lipase
MNLFDSEGKKKTAINYTLNATICDQMKVWSLMEDNLMKALTAIKFIGSSGRVDQFTLGRQLQIMFGKDGKLSFDSSSQQLCHYPLQGMLINYNVKKSNEPQESLIFHCHGGGFVCMTPKGHEPYLRFWAQQTKTPVLCVNYGKAPLNPYPCGLQDLLDAFLFITSGRQEVLDILGFHPKNIIVTGDSAGGNLALTLTLALAAVKNNVNASQILPRAIFTQYPCGDPSVTVNASRTFISFDPLLTPACVFTIGSAYSGVDQMKMMESEELQKMMESEELHKIVNGSRNITEADDPKVSGNKISPENEVTKETDSKDSSSVKEDEHSNTNTEDSLTEVSNNLVSTQHSSSNDDDSVSKSPTAKSPPPSSMNSESSQLPWFRRSREEVISIASKVAMKSSDPFFNPLSCDKIPSFLIDNIPLLIQACEFDPLLDDSIAIARWYASQGGSVVLDVVEGVQHGFMIAIGHKSLQPAVDVSVTRIKQGLGLLPLLGLKSRTNRQEEEETQQTEKTESNSESMQEVQNS